MTTLTISEAAFQTSVIELAQTVGWKVAHFRPAQTTKGWRTPVSADGAGYPDLTMVRPPELLIVELKTDRGKLTRPQQAWLQALEMSGIEIAVWRPRDWDGIKERLTRPKSGRIHWTGTELERDAA